VTNSSLIHTRTQVVSFLFIDLVAFSKESTASQHQIKTVLIQHLSAALAPIPFTEYRLRDTGDGAFVAFWSNPEFALYTALALWQTYIADSGSEALPRQLLRVGLHIGTVKETRDVEGRVNYVGDGINAAKRIQNLAEPGQMLASRSFFDAFDHLDADYSRLFSQVGSGDDKHGRSYELFSLNFGEAALAKLSQEIEQHKSHSRNAAASEQKSEHPLSQVGDFIKTWFVPVNSVLALVTFYVSYFGRLVKPASVMYYTGLILLALAIFMGLAARWFKSAKGSDLAARRPKWAAFLHHKPINWLSLGLGLTLLVAAYFVNQQDDSHKEPALVQSPAKLVPVPQITISAPPPDAVAPAFVASDLKPLPAISSAPPVLHSTGKNDSSPAPSEPRMQSAKTGKLPGKTNTASPRCTSLLQKAVAGETLSSQEQKEMVSICQ
jgi:hypothetical protein